jgi:poly(3-hydroxybutyrate) depolymerase
MTYKQHVPTIKDMVSSPYVCELAISPDGGQVAYIARTADWEKNRYCLTCFIYNCETGCTYQVASDAWNIRWFDEYYLGFLHPSENQDPNKQDKVQVHLYGTKDCTIAQISDAAVTIERFWFYGQGILFLAPSSKQETENDGYVFCINVGHERRKIDLFFAPLRLPFSLETLSDYTGILLTGSLDPSLKNLMDVVPYQSSRVFLNCRPGSEFQDIQVLELNADADTLTQAAFSRDYTPTAWQWRRTQFPKNAAVWCVSPDGKQLLLNWESKRKDDGYSNEAREIWCCDLSEAGSLRDNLHCLTSDLDLQFLSVRWSAQSGIFVQYLDGCVPRVACLRKPGEIQGVNFGQIYPMAFDISNNGVLVAVTGGPESIPKLILSTITSDQLAASAGNSENIQNFCSVMLATDGSENWDWGTMEKIRWPSRDGIEIEGILYKPSDFAPNRQYPLIVIVHGGPGTASLSIRRHWEDCWFYPTQQFLARGILVLKPNYRGSDGRGHQFLELNRKHPGEGELRDIETGIEYLVQRGIVDRHRVGCAGWSAGGTISAFACVRSSLFKAVSVGAAYTDCNFYYATSCYPEYIERLLSGLPWEKKSAYWDASSAWTTVRTKIPTLIQHGDADNINAIAHGQALYRTLFSQNVPVEFFLFPGMGHGVPNCSPKAALTVMSQNLKWFSHHLLGLSLDWSQPDELEG